MIHRGHLDQSTSRSVAGVLARLIVRSLGFSWVALKQAQHGWLLRVGVLFMPLPRHEDMSHGVEFDCSLLLLPYLFNAMDPQLDVKANAPSKHHLLHDIVERRHHICKAVLLTIRVPSLTLAG